MSDQKPPMTEAAEEQLLLLRKQKRIQKRLEAGKAALDAFQSELQERYRVQLVARPALTEDGRTIAHLVLVAIE